VTFASESITAATLAAERAVQLAALALPAGETVLAGHGAGGAPAVQNVLCGQAVQFAGLDEPGGDEVPVGHGAGSGPPQTGVPLGPIGHEAGSAQKVPAAQVAQAGAPAGDELPAAQGAHADAPAAEA
jgi:hypothetical protein